MKPTKIAYVSMEFGINNDMNTYCGGLGILSGDILKTSADYGHQIGIEMVGISLLYKNGWFKQVVTQEGHQEAMQDPWDYLKYLKNTNKSFEININSEKVKVEILEYTHTSPISNDSVKLYFLNTDLETNSPKMRLMSNQVYPSDQELWFSQQALLGLGALELDYVMELGIKKFHLNESHGAYLGLALYDKYQNWGYVRSHLVFTTHTPLETAHQKKLLPEIAKLIGDKYIKYIPNEYIIDNKINFTTLCLFASGFSNGVAKRHGDVTQKMYPKHKVNYVTNGAHISTWICDKMAKIYDQYFIGWRNDPDMLRSIGIIPDQLLQDIHFDNKVELCNYINKLYSKYNKNFNPHTFTIGFARRTVSYKRANLILTELDRLKKIAEKYGELQIVFSGKAYPTDIEGAKMIESLIKSAKENNSILKIAFIEDYDMALAKKIVLGSDLWLNNPVPPLEASGTSGMKASMNGIPNFSILDGWWVEGHLEEETGWSIGQDLAHGEDCQDSDINDLYDKLENQIYKAWKDPIKWAQIRKTCIALNATYFNTHRALKEYALKAYLN